MTEKKQEAPPELTDREVYNTPIGPVCMSKTEHEAYIEELEWQEMKDERSATLQRRTEK